LIRVTSRHGRSWSLQFEVTAKVAVAVTMTVIVVAARSGATTAEPPSLPRPLHIAVPLSLLFAAPGGDDAAHRALAACRRVSPAQLALSADPRLPVAHSATAT
jgi:hypothetical protein